RSAENPPAAPQNPDGLNPSRPQTKRTPKGFLLTKRILAYKSLLAVVEGFIVLSAKGPFSRDQLLRAFTVLLDAAIESGREQMRQEIYERVAPARQRQSRPATATAESAPIDFPLTNISPQKRGAQDRARHGAIKKAVEAAVKAHPEGISRPEIVRYAKDKLGVTIKAGSLKNAIRILKEDNLIHNRDRKWFPAPF